MRPIDAKALEMQTKEAFKENPVVMGMLLRWLRKQPTIDAVPVVRCKDCKHWTVDGAGNRWCHMWETHQTHEDVFCCFGERKDGEG